MKISPEAEAAVSEARKYGATDIEIELGGKHLRVYFTFNGKRQFVTCSSTGGDRRGPANVRQSVRRALGIDRTPQKGQRRAKRRVAPGKRPEVPTITPGKDYLTPFRMEYLKTLTQDQLWATWFRGIMEKLETA